MCKSKNSDPSTLKTWTWGTGHKGAACQPLAAEVPSPAQPASRGHFRLTGMSLTPATTTARHQCDGVVVSTGHDTICRSGCWSVICFCDFFWFVKWERLKRGQYPLCELQLNKTMFDQARISGHVYVNFLHI